MSITVQQIYDAVTAACLEPGGFVLGVFTEAQFLHTLAYVLLDFSQRAPLGKAIFTEMIVSGTAEYVVPDYVVYPEVCFVGGRLIEQTTEADLTQNHLQWRLETGPTKQWHEDNLGVKRLELSPIPDFNGATIAGQPPYGKYGDFYPTERNLTMVGPSAPNKTVWTLADTLDGIPDSFAHYLTYGILEQIFSGENELRDAQRALYCHTRYEESILLSKAISAEELMDEGDD